MAINRRQQRKLEREHRKLERERRKLEREHRKLHGDSRRLHSGKGLSPRTVLPQSVRGSGRRYLKQPASLVFADPHLIAEQVALKGPQRREDGQGSHDMSAPSPGSVGSRTQPLAIGVDDGGESLAQGDNPAHLGSPSHLQESAERTSAEIDLAGNDPQHTRTSEGAASEGTPYGRHVEDVGIPIDEKWRIEAAHERRVCRDHGKEWLLEYCDRWMSPCDFDFGGAEAELKKMLQHYQSTSEPQKGESTVNCDCSYLWSEVDTPVQYDDAGDKYLIRWKWRWTPESDIDDLPGVKDSDEGQNVMEKRHCSDQVGDTAQATVASRKSIMAVVELED